MTNEDKQKKYEFLSDASYDLKIEITGKPSGRSCFIEYHIDETMVKNNEGHKNLLFRDMLKYMTGQLLSGSDTALFKDKK